MSRIPRRIACPEARAEGAIFTSNNVATIPYDTDIVSADGCAIHLWMGERANDMALVREALRIAHRHRDIVQATYSGGNPTGYWASSTMALD